MLYDIRTVSPISNRRLRGVVISFSKEFWGKNSIAQGCKNPGKTCQQTNQRWCFCLCFSFFFVFRLGPLHIYTLLDNLFSFWWLRWLQQTSGGLWPLWFPKVLAFLKAMATNHGTEETLAATVFVARNVWNPSSDFWMKKHINYP